MLLGRERERQALDRVLASARSGRSEVLALVGEAGIGKTALLDFAAGNAQGMLVLRARGIESEAQVPFAGLLELLRPALRLVERIPEPQAAALERALLLRPGGAGERFAVGAATLSLLAAYAEEHPALVLIDDAHLLDASTAEALRFALRRLLAEPLAAVLAVRQDEPSLLDDADLPALHVGGLDRESAARLLGPLAADTADRLYAATAGNPLALIELASDARLLDTLAVEAPIPVPAKVSRAFVRRSRQLDDAGRRLLVLAAASDATDLVTLERAAAVLGLDLAGLDAMEQTGLVRVAGNRLEFRHPLARSAVYAEATPEQRRQAHRALAAALPDRDADRRAWHLAAAAAGSDDAASSALEQAAQRARARSAYAESAAAFSRAAQLAVDDPRRARLLAAAADAAWLAGSADSAVVMLGEARALAADTPLLIEVERLRGHITTRRGPVMDGHAILVAAAERAAPADPEVAIGLLAEAVDATFFAGNAVEMERTARRALELLPADASPRARFLAATAVGMARVFAGDARNGIASLREAVTLAEQNAELRSDPQLLSWLVMGPLWLREAESGRALVEQAIETARHRAALGILPWLLNRVARGHAAADAPASAAVEFDEAIRLARESGQETELAAALAGLAWLEARLGHEDDCRAHAAEARDICGRLGMGLYDTWATRALGELELGLGRPASAIEHLEESQRQLAALQVHDVDTSPAAELVDAYLRVGRTADATAAAAELETQSKAKGQPWPLARAARCRGLLAPDGDFAEHFEHAVALHLQTPDVFELARTRLAYGVRLRRSRHRAQARDQLRIAVQIFDRLGAVPWSEQSRAELQATGEVARRRDVSTLDSLTRQELRIAQLLAAGRTTREAAAALFLSPKTVEYHLRSVYRKLDVNSRAQLAGALASDDPGPPQL